MNTYSDPRELNTLRPCCLSVQLNTIFKSFNTTLKSLGTAIEKEFPAEPEITLSSILEWLVWEVPTMHITLTLPDITPTLITTFNTLLARDNVSVGKPRRPLIRTIELNVPTGLRTSIPLDAFLHRHQDRVSVHYRRKAIEQTTLHLHDAEDFRWNLPIEIECRGELPQEGGTKLHKVTFRVQTLKAPNPNPFP